MLAASLIAPLAELSTELFDEVASRCQIGKAPAVKDLLLPNNRTSVMRLNMSRLMKIYDPAAHCDIQSVGGDGKLYDVWVLALIRHRLGTTKLNMLLCASAVHQIDNSSRRSLTQHRGQLGDMRRNPSHLSVLRVASLVSVGNYLRRSRPRVQIAKAAISGEYIAQMVARLERGV
jgi:hypothetical protein